VERAAPKRGERERFNRTGELSAKMSLQSHVELALKESPTATEFIDRLQLVGVDVIPYMQKDGRATGVSFRKGKQLMKGSDLGRGFSWNALQERGLDYNHERDRPAIDAAKQRADMNRETINPPTMTTPSTEHSLVDIAKDAGRAAGQYMIDQMNPIRQIQNQVQMYQDIGKTISEGYNLAKEVLTRDNNIENLQRAAGVEPDGRDALERLHQSMNIETGSGGNNALERLNDTIGIERKDPLAELTQTPAKEIAPTLEPAIEEHTLEATIELIL
jgi:hypothetical protein